jgi:class 3 adenylate cyclase
MAMSIRFARVDDAHVAYRVLSEGPIDILLMIGEYLSVDAIDEEPRYARCLRRLSSIGRVIVFNRRGVGLSDPPVGLLTQEQNVEDAIAVLDAVGSARAAVVGWNTAGYATIRLAAEHPDRISALVLINAYARIIEAPDYPEGWPADIAASTAQQTVSTEEPDPSDPDAFDFLRFFAPTVADDTRFRAWWDQAGNRALSPGRAADFWNLTLQSDERDQLQKITSPTLVIHRATSVPSAAGRYIADRIDGARLVELPGADLMWWVGESDPILDEIEIFLAGMGAAFQTLRKLATVLFFDVVASTEHAARLGDRRWRELLETYVDVARREIDRGGGQLISTSGDGALATFDMPADAVRTGTRIAGAVRALGIEIKAGIHTGEIEIVGDDVAGLGVHIAARVMSAAGPGEVLVSRTVCDLVTGSGLDFDDRGEHDLKGVPGEWRLFAVKP